MYQNDHEIDFHEKFLKKGDKVRFIGATDDQVKWDSFDDPRQILSKDEIYEIESVDVHHWFTRICLKDVKGRFNSVHFNFA